MAGSRHTMYTSVFSFIPEGNEKNQQSILKTKILNFYSYSYLIIYQLALMLHVFCVHNDKSYYLFDHTINKTLLLARNVKMCFVTMLDFPLK